MEERVKKLLEKHKDDKNLTSEMDYIELGWDWSEADLSGWNLEGLKLSNNENKANLKNVNFSRANLQNINFASANLEKAYFGGTNLKNAILRGSVLKGAYLRGAILEDATLYKSCLQSADMTGANLHNTKLWSSNLKGAKLQRADLRNARFNDKTILNDVDWYQCQIDNSTLKLADNQLDKKVIQEKNNDYSKAKEVYRNLKNYFRQEGIYNISGEYYYREKLMETKYNWKEKKYLQWIGNMFLNLITGYGERPLNILIWWISIIFGCAFIYYFFSGIYNSIANNITSYNPNFLETLYFSINTFMTLSFGDLVPKSGFFQIFSSFEALLGAIFMALFIFVFARKMIR
jgi:hypothetical protein